MAEPEFSPVAPHIALILPPNPILVHLPPFQPAHFLQVLGCSSTGNHQHWDLQGRPALPLLSRVEIAFATPKVHPSAYCAALCGTCGNGSTAFTNTLESVCGSLAFCCSIALSGRSNSTIAEIAQEVMFAVGVVRVVVGLTIPGPAGVGFVRVDVIWMGLHLDRLASHCSNPAFCCVHSRR